MKTACTSRIAFLKPRVSIGFALYAAGLVLALAPMSSAIAGDNAAAELSPSIPAHLPGRLEVTGDLPGRWIGTGDLVTGRARHGATLLPNGQVLVAGGLSNLGGILATAELYDPATGMWTATGSMADGRYIHTATSLPNGQVLVADGFGCCPPHLVVTAELYDPESGNWTATDHLNPKRFNHTATLLLNGKVLVSGGNAPNGILARAELYESAPEMLDIP